MKSAARFYSRPVLSWALYDWANSVFATVVIAGFFPVVFRQYWSAGLTSGQGTFWLGSANSAASLLIVLVAPLLGSLADCKGWRKHLLLLFMLLGVVATASLYGVEAGAWQTALWLYFIALAGFMSANIFYDSLLVNVSAAQNLHRLSGLGYALGYFGGGLLLAVCVLLSRQPEWFGFASAMDAVLFAFLLVAAWWLIFSLPLALWVKESPALRTGQNQPGIWRETRNTLTNIFAQRDIRLFLLAYWIYIDGVDTIIFMAVDYGMSLGFSASDLIMALLITQFVGFPAAIIFSRIGERVGVKTILLAGIAVYALITLWGYHMTTPQEFYYLAVAIGLVQGGVQALSRSWYARMIPAERAAEYFGVYNMVGKTAAVLGPLLMGLVVVLTNNHRYSILSVLIFFVAGFALLLGVKKPST
ncbi:MAG: transporter, family [Pseudomonadota bacterium]|nr:transporter, family [Pseudomonadota bacterium]